MATMAIEKLPEGCTITRSIKLSDSTDCKEIKGCEDLSQGTPDKNCGICCLLQTVYVVTDWMFYLLTILVVFMVIYGGFAYITAAGDPEKAGKGKKILTYAIIGLAIALLAKIIPSVVKFIVGV